MLVFFLFYSVLNPYKSQEMCNEAAHDCLATLNLFLIGLLQVK